MKYLCPVCGKGPVVDYYLVNDGVWKQSKLSGHVHIACFDKVILEIRGTGLCLEDFDPNVRHNDTIIWALTKMKD